MHAAFPSQFNFTEVISFRSFLDLKLICNLTTIKTMSSKEHLTPTSISVHSAYLSHKSIFLHSVRMNPGRSGQKSVPLHKRPPFSEMSDPATPLLNSRY